MPKNLSLVKTGHWEFSWEGRKEWVPSPPNGMSQKTYEAHFLPSLRVYGGELSQKNGCGTMFGAAAYFVIGGNFMKNKKLILSVVALALVIALMACVYLTTRPEAVEGQKNVTIAIVYEDGTEKQMEYATTCQYLSELLLEKELVTGYASQEYGFTIESVDGIMLDWATDGAYWALYEGENYATESAAGIVLTEGGIYRLVYEKF